MKVLYRVLAHIITLGCISNIWAEAIVIRDERYVTIIDNKTLLGDRNFNMIRLYMQGVKPRYRKNLPVTIQYTETLGEQLQVLQAQQDLLKSGRYIVACKDNKEYFYATFSTEVDHYLFEELELASTLRKQSATNTWSIPGEIIYFDEYANPCEVEIGAFQYTIDEQNNCLDRTFTRNIRTRLVTSRANIIRKFTDRSHNLYRLAVERQIDSFLSEQVELGCDFFSNLWKKEITALLAEYKKKIGSDFV